MLDVVRFEVEQDWRAPEDGAVDYRAVYGQDKYFHRLALLFNEPESQTVIEEIREKELRGDIPHSPDEVLQLEYSIAISRDGYNCKLLRLAGISGSTETGPDGWKIVDIVLPKADKINEVVAGLDLPDDISPYTLFDFQGANIPNAVYTDMVADGRFGISTSPTWELPHDTRHVLGAVCRPADVKAKEQAFAQKTQQLRLLHPQVAARRDGLLTWYVDQTTQRVGDFPKYTDGTYKWARSFYKSNIDRFGDGLMLELVGDFEDFKTDLKSSIEAKDVVETQAAIALAAAA